MTGIEKHFTHSQEAELFLTLFGSSSSQCGTLYEGPYMEGVLNSAVSNRLIENF